MLPISPPVFPHAVIDRPGHRDITIGAPDADDTHTYVDAVRLNGRAYDKSWTGAGLLRSGATLDFRLAAQPNTRWATDPADLPK